MFPLLLALAALGCDGLYNPDDCLQDPDRDCATYRPAGLVCGLLTMTEDATQFGRACNGYNPVVESATGTPCPTDDEGAPLYVDGMVRTHGARLSWRFCAAAGNDARSSRDLSEIPAGTACGLASAHSVTTSRACQDVHPLRDGACPTGFTLRVALDRYQACPADQPPLPDPVACERPDDLPVPVLEGCDGAGLPDLGHLVAWCERNPGGCVDCAYPDDVICGMHAPGGGGPSDPMFWRRLRWEELGPALCDTMHAAWQEQRAMDATCRGVEVAVDGCPAGTSLTCLADALGDDRVDDDALCFCSSGALIDE